LRIADILRRSIEILTEARWDAAGLHGVLHGQILMSSRVVYHRDRRQEPTVGFDHRYSPVVVPTAFDRDCLDEVARLARLEVLQRASLTGFFGPLTNSRVSIDPSDRAAELSILLRLTEPQAAAVIGRDDKRVVATQTRPECRHHLCAAIIADITSVI
jgi:hypothetical protein